VTQNVVPATPRAEHVAQQALDAEQPSGFIGLMGRVPGVPRSPGAARSCGPGSGSRAPEPRPPSGRRQCDLDSASRCWSSSRRASHPPIDASDALFESWNLLELHHLPPADTVMASNLLIYGDLPARGVAHLLDDLVRPRQH
jgi:hypothetical protein